MLLCYQLELYKLDTLTWIIHAAQKLWVSLTVLYSPIGLILNWFLFLKEGNYYQQGWVLFGIEESYTITIINIDGITSTSCFSEWWKN